MDIKENRVVLTKAGLEDDIKVKGLTRKEMANKYGIPVTQIKKALSMVGLDGVKPTRVLFEIADVAPTTEVVDVPQCPSPAVQDVVEEVKAPMHVLEDGSYPSTCHHSDEDCDSGCVRAEVSEVAKVAGRI